MKHAGKCPRSAVLLFLFAFVTLGVARGDPGVPAATVTKIEEAITAFMARTNAPGLSVAIGLKGQLRFENGYGLANMENFVPAKGSTIYRLASVSKPITAVAAMLLVERGVLKLDHTVGKWLPHLPAALHPITVRQLLSHQSGIRHYTAEEDDPTRHYPRHYESLGEALAIFKDDPLVHAPGTKMTYSTYAFTLLGVLIEKASKQTYVDFVRANIFKPAGMIHSRAEDPQVIVLNRSAGYAKTREGGLRNAAFMDPSYKIPSGGWLSSVGDMVRFGLKLQSGTLLTAESVKQMTTMQGVAGGEDTFYGLGWIVEGGIPGTGRVPGLMWHGGVQQGVTTNLYMLSSERTVVAVMINLEGEGMSLANLAAEITRIALVP
ncbi:MAG: serine hydrolase domain-containing protein [Verrucomicrobiota bacterium]